MLLLLCADRQLISIRSWVLKSYHGVLQPGNSIYTKLSESSTSTTNLHGSLIKQLLVLKPWPMNSHVDASFNLRFVWSPNGVDSYELRGLSLTLAELKFARKSTHVFHRLATQRKSTQVDRKSTVYSAWNLRLFATCESVWPPIASPYASSGFANLRWLASTCESVWPPFASPYTSSGFANLRRLASPFGQSFSPAVQSTINLTQDYRLILVLISQPTNKRFGSKKSCRS